MAAAVRERDEAGRKCADLQALVDETAALCEDHKRRAENALAASANKAQAETEFAKKLQAMQAECEQQAAV